MKYPILMFGAIWLVVSLSGCGGGGSDGRSSEPQDNEIDAAIPATPEIRLQQQFYLTEESRRLVVIGDFSEPDSVRVTSQMEVPVTVHQVEPDALILNVPNVDRPRSLDFGLEFLYGERQFTLPLTLSIQNTSAKALEQQVQSALAEPSWVLNLAQDKVLYEFFLEYAYVTGLLRHSQKQELMHSFSPSEAPERASVELGFSALSQAWEDYGKGELSDAQLQAEIQFLEEAIRLFGAYGQRVLAGIEHLSGALFPPVSEGVLEYDPRAGFYSRFVSGDLYGRYEHDGFVLHESYQPLRSLIRTQVAQNLQCGELQ